MVLFLWDVCKRIKLKSILTEKEKMQKICTILLFIELLLTRLNIKNKFIKKIIVVVIVGKCLEKGDIEESIKNNNKQKNKIKKNNHKKHKITKKNTNKKY